MEIKTVTTVGSQWKPVTCEECGHRFEYTMTRVGAASATDWFDPLGGRAAGLGDAADYELRYKLRQETELRPCPMCGVYQSNMVHPVEIRPKWLVAGVVVVLVAVLLVIDAIMKNVSIPVWLGLLIVAGGGAAAHKPMTSFSVHLWNKMYESKYARLNANRNMNKRKAAALEKNGALRSVAAPVQ